MGRPVLPNAIQVERRSTFPLYVLCNVITLAGTRGVDDTLIRFFPNFENII